VTNFWPPWQEGLATDRLFTCERLPKATAPTRYDRYQTVTKLADDIRHFLNNEPISALPDTPVRKALRWIGRHRQAVLLIFMGLLLVTFGAIAWSFYQHAATLAEAQEHKERLSRYLSAASERSHLIEKQFLFFDELLEGLATATVEARMRGTPSTDAIYRLGDFRTPGQGPPDLAPSSQYRGAPISIEYPVHILWAGEPGSVLQQTLSRLAPLRHQFSRMFLLSHPEKNPNLPLADARRIIGTEGVPLIWSYIALREGAVIVYPGHDIDIPDGYDPRQRPWYQMAAGKNGKFWGNPHVDNLGQGLLLSCAMSLYDETGQFFGVAGVDLTFDYIIDELMTIPDLPLVESFLLDEQGRIVISSSERDPAAFTGGPRPLYPDPEIVAELKTGQFDYREVERDGREIWIVYDDLEILGWSYLAEFAPE
jgi:serine/threonine-protein kinase